LESPVPLSDGLPSTDIAAEQNGPSQGSLPDEPLKVSRVPPEVQGVQLNFCKSPTCANYGNPPEQVALRGEEAKTKPNSYALAGAGKGFPVCKCKVCMESFPLKSNIGIVEELQRMRPVIAEACCPDESCSNHGIGVSVGKAFYSSFGTSTIGSKRYKCKACGKTFSTATKSTHRQRETHKNKEIFALLVNKTPMRRIVELAEVSPQTVYDKIDFIWRQCVAFANDREARLPSLEVPRMYIGVDKQDYAINWTKREDRRNVVLSAVSFVDNGTGYALGTWLNFDRSADAATVEEETYQSGNAYLPIPMRRHARLWTSLDYDNSVQASAKKRASGGLADSIAATYEHVARRNDLEASDTPTPDARLPEMGMQVHTEYLLYGSFLRMREMLGKVEKVRFFLDQDSGMRAACLGAWADRVKDRSCDAFYVSIAKNMNVDQKRMRAAMARDEITAAMAADGLNRNEAVLKVLKSRIAAARTIGKWNDRWVFHPQATMSEPEKAMCHLTDLGDYDEDHLAWLYNKASLHGVDSYFNRIRRRVSLLERGIHSQGNAGRVWNGYAPYNPDQIQKLLDIFRVCHNYMWTREVPVKADPVKGKESGKAKTEKKTPAMLLGLAKGVVTYEDIIYFKN
jgi:transposase-like protein